MTGKYLTENTLYVKNIEDVKRLESLLKEDGIEVNKCSCNKSCEERKRFLDKVGTETS